MTKESDGKPPVHYFAKSVSYLFHPLLIPTITLWFIFHAKTYLNLMIPSALQMALEGLVFISTFIFPVLSVWLLLFMGRITSMEMDSPEERRLPYLLTAVYYSLGYYLLTSKMELPEQISLVLLGATVSVTLTLIITLKWKLSAHTVGAGGLIGALLGVSHQLGANMLNELIAAVFIGGLVGYARLRLGSHNPAQVYTGYLLGFLCEFLLFFL